MRTLTLYVLLLAALFVLGSVFGPTPVVQAAGNLDGKAVFEAEKCSLCHSVEGAGIEAKTTSDKLKGPDLSGYEPAAGFDTRAFIRKQVEKNGELHRREFKGTDEELQALLDWLKASKK